eukprot:6173951-Pleurochrysis_carterae.AAC.2
MPCCRASGARRALAVLQPTRRARLAQGVFAAGGGGRVLHWSAGASTLLRAEQCRVLPLSLDAAVDANGRPRACTHGAIDACAFQSGRRSDGSRYRGERRWGSELVRVDGVNGTSLHPTVSLPMSRAESSMRTEAKVKAQHRLHANRKTPRRCAHLHARSQGLQTCKRANVQARAW